MFKKSGNVAELCHRGWGLSINFCELGRVVVIFKRLRSPLENR